MYECARVCVNMYVCMYVRVFVRVSLCICVCVSVQVLFHTRTPLEKGEQTKESGEYRLGSIAVSYLEVLVGSLAFFCHILFQEIHIVLSIFKQFVLAAFH